MNDESLTPQEPQAPSDKEEKGSLKLDLFFWVQALAVALVCLILTFSLAGRVIRVVGSSMVPTLHEGDLMLLQSIGYTSKQGDVVVLRKSSFMSDPIVKRVIAVGGQHVSIDYDTNTVTVDGTVLDEPYILEVMQDPNLHHFGTYQSEIDVPEGSIFVMGDNRNNSEDSRFADVGFVPFDLIKGKASLVFWPISQFKTLP